MTPRAIGWALVGAAGAFATVVTLAEVAVIVATGGVVRSPGLRRVLGLEGAPPSGREAAS